MYPKIFLPIAFLFLLNHLQAQDINFKSLSYSQLDSVTDVFYNQGAYDKAIPCMQYALGKAMAEFGKQHARYAQYANDLALFYDLSGQYALAEPYYLEAVDIRKKVLGEWHEKYAESINNLADLYTTLGRYKEAEPLFLKSIEINKKTLGESHHEYGGFLNNLSRLYETMGRYEAAEKLYKQVAEIDKKSLGETHPFYAASLNNLANLYQRMGHFEEAEPLYLQAKAIRAKALGEQHPDYAITLHNFAVLYDYMGKREEAELMFLQAKDIRKKALGELHPYYAASLENLARINKERGNYDDARMLYEQCLYIIKKTLGTGHYTYADVLKKIALLYDEMGLEKEAEATYFQAIEIYKNNFGEAHPFYLAAVKNLASFYKDSKDYEKALTIYLQVQTGYEKIQGKSQTDYVELLTNIAEVFFLKNQMEMALNYEMASIVANSENFEAVFPNFSQKTCSFLKGNCTEFQPADFLKLSELKYLRILHFNTAANGISNILLSQYESFVKEKKELEAKLKLESYYNISKIAIEINERVRNEFSAIDNKLSALKQKHKFIDAAINGALKFGAQNYLEEAFQYAEQNKSALLADAVKGNRARALGNLPDSLALLELALQSEKDQLKKQKEEVRNTPQEAAIIRQENQLNTRIDAFLKSLKDKYPQYHALKYEDITAKSSDIQLLLDNKTLLLEYFVSDAKTYLFVLSKNTIDVIVIPISKKELNANIKDLRSTLSDLEYINEKRKESYILYTKTAYWFYENLVAPAIQGKAIQHLIIVTDGELGHLPFETFLQEAVLSQTENYAGLNYLVKNYNISYNYSATLWKENLTASNTATATNGKVLACAAQYNELDSSLLDLRLPYLFDWRKNLQPLPEAEKEVDVLRKTFEGTFFQDEAANEAFFKSNAHEYSVIHLAMHGILHERLPILSALAFTENRDSVEDNFLQAYEISKMRLNANLVVLSACETGYGKFEQGEGVISLARSFMYAGVPSLVVSLWQVNDYSTSEIMKFFYLHLADGMPKDAALRQAKLDYIQHADGFAAHPTFWSAFIQLGDSRPINIAGKTNWLWWALGGVTLLLAGGIFFKKRTAKK